MKTLLIALLLISSFAQAGEHRIGLGLFTEHFIQDRGTYNESNELISYSYIADNQMTYNVASFENSYYVDSQMISIGYEWAGIVGVTLAAVKGYGGILKTHYKDIIFTPIFYVETYGFRHTVMGPAYNLSYVIKF